jgi:hypothetical protein
MGLFGGSTHQVRILGPLLLAGKPVACPEKGCGDTGKGGGHTLTAAGEKGIATITCGANPQHQWRLPEVTIAAVKQLPRKGRFELRHGDALLVGIAARPGTGGKQKPAAGPPARALAQQAAPAPRGGGGSQPGLAAVLVAGLGTATAGLNAIGQVARTGTEVARAGNNAISLARDGAQIAGRELDARRTPTTSPAPQLGQQRTTPKRAL